MPGKKPEQNIILFTGKIYTRILDTVEAYAKKTKRGLRIGFIYDTKQKLSKTVLGLMDRFDVTIQCDTHSQIALQKALLPYKDQLLALVCRGEDKIPLFSRVIPHVPYLKTPTVESLRWSTDKLFMRRRLFYHNRKITPGYTVVKDATKKSLDKVERVIGFPVIVKPTSLAASRLVSICYHREELEKTLRRVFRKMKSVHKQSNGTWEDPKVVVEQYVEGEMYSVDVYVNARGNVTFCPMVHVVTGKAIGFDDFFGYRQMTPTLLNKKSIASAQAAAKEAIHALGLRSITAHVEMVRTENGWLIIEVGPRIGGFRDYLYNFSYGIDHTMNDILTRIPEKVRVPKKRKGYSAAMKFFAKKEGILSKLTGIKKINDLESVKKLYVNKKIGDKCLFAKHGGSSVFNVVLFNESRSKLLADIRRLEQMVTLETK